MVARADAFQPIGNARTPNLVQLDESVDPWTTDFGSIIRCTGDLPDDLFAEPFIQQFCERWDEYELNQIQQCDHRFCECNYEDEDE
jgi:hypothetical protein